MSHQWRVPPNPPEFWARFSRVWKRFFAAIGRAWQGFLRFLSRTPTAVPSTRPSIQDRLPNRWFSDHTARVVRAVFPIPNPTPGASRTLVLEGTTVNTLLQAESRTHPGRHYANSPFDNGLFEETKLEFYARIDAQIHYLTQYIGSGGKDFCLLQEFRWFIKPSEDPIIQQKQRILEDRLTDNNWGFVYSGPAQGSQDLAILYHKARLTPIPSTEANPNPRAVIPHPDQDRKRGVFGGLEARFTCQDPHDPAGTPRTVALVCYHQEFTDPLRSQQEALRTLMAANTAAGIATLAGGDANSVMETFGTPTRVSTNLGCDEAGALTTVQTDGQPKGYDGFVASGFHTTHPPEVAQGGDFFEMDADQTLHMRTEPLAVPTAGPAPSPTPRAATRYSPSPAQSAVIQDPDATSAVAERRDPRGSPSVS